MDQSADMQEKLAAALREFAAMQRKHADLLAEGRLKSLPEWVEQREHVFLHLRQCIARFAGTILDEKSAGAVQLRKIMEEIVDNERSLKMQVQDRLGEIREKLQILRRGKGMLKGYSLNHGAGPKPKYLSSKA
ncbi:MAG: hypothetical protein AB1461_02870 [Thermodesulfobacteriota bacterium]